MKPTLLMFALALLASPLFAQEPRNVKEPPNSISGRVTNLDGPLQDAEAILTFYPDESCAALARKEKRTDADQVRLKSCEKEAQPIRTDKDGRFAFASLQEGFYQLQISWKTERQPPSFPKVGDLPVLMTATVPDYNMTSWETRDQPPKYYIVAVSNVFKLPAQATLTKDLKSKW